MPKDKAGREPGSKDYGKSAKKKGRKMAAVFTRSTSRPSIAGGRY